MFESFFQNTRKPKDNFSGRLMLKMMNKGHHSGSLWALSQKDFSDRTTVLDIGCGGGRNISNLLHLAPQSIVYGLDYSPASVKASQKYNKGAISSGRAKVLQGNVSALPFENQKFDAITAFETVYFWPGPEESFQEVFRVLQPGGFFLIFNEVNKGTKGEKWSEIIDMNIYSDQELKHYLENVGFSQIEIYSKGSNQWLTLIAYK